MMDLKDFWTRQEQYRDLTQEASTHRLLTGGRRRRPWKRRAMRELGEYLVALGWQLQQRYGPGPSQRGREAMG